MPTLTPINMAEAIIEPFWDASLSGLGLWRIDAGDAHGLRVYQNWCWVGFEWARKPATGPALRMHRRFDTDVSGYDTLLVSIMAPAGAVLRLTAETDAGMRTCTSPPAGRLKQEHALPLDGAARLVSLTLEMDAGADGVAEGWINWIGLRNSQLLPRYQAQWDRFDTAWAPYLKPESFEPSFRPVYGLLTDETEIAALRERHDAFVRAGGASPFLAAAEEARQHEPERMVRDFVNFWGDTRYCRERDHGNMLLGNGAPGYGVRAAIAGLLLKDKNLLRLAARYAMALGHCGCWDDGMICRFPGGVFEHRCFVQSLVLQDLTLILDLAGEYFTDTGRDFLLRRMAEEGLGAILYNTWRYEYIFHCNQLAWFTPGRMLACLLLERHWPRAKPHTELAFADLIENLGYAILPDGGYVEGPTYFTCVGRSGGFPLYLYARARGKAFGDVIPDNMRRTAGFAAAIASTDDAKDVIPICDSADRLDLETLGVMASLLPDSPWVGLFRKALARCGGMPGSLFAAQLSQGIPEAAPAPPAFTFLPDMGVMASLRRLGGHWVKLLIMGNKANAGHTHEDKGSFVLEFAGDTFAMDPGTCDYSSPVAGLLKNAERHNMLVPFGGADRPHPACPLPHEVKPSGQGDARRFRAEIDATPGWDGWFRKWQRCWDSPAPDRLTIHDEYELLRGDGVEFCWQTRLPVRVEAGVVRIVGRQGLLELTIPSATEVRVDELPLFLDGDVQRRIVFRCTGRSGKIAVEVRLTALG